jgi:hypothetical protein
MAHMARSAVSIDCAMRSTVARGIRHDLREVANDDHQRPCPPAPPQGPAPYRRSKMHERAAAERVRFVKAGARTLVDIASLRADVASLPEAQIGKTV